MKQPDKNIIIKENINEALKHLIAIRKYNEAWRYEFLYLQNHKAWKEGKKEEKMSIEKLIKLSSCDVHPIYFSLTLAYLRVTKKDFNHIIMAFCGVFKARPYSFENIISMNFVSDSILDEVLDVHEEIMLKLQDLGFSILVKNGKFLPFTNKPSVWDIYWGIWVVLNPIYYRDKELVAKYFCSFGMYFDNFVHKNIRKQERELNKVMSQLKKSLNDKMKFKRLLNKQRIIAQKVAIARETYMLMPHEISAFGIEHSYVVNEYNRLPNESLPDDFLKYELSIEQIQQIYHD